MCNSGKGHQFPLLGWGLAGLTRGSLGRQRGKSASYVQHDGIQRTLTCVLMHPIDAELHIPLLQNRSRGGLCNGDQMVGRQRPADCQ